LSDGSWENILIGLLCIAFVGAFVSALILIRGLYGEYNDPHSTVMGRFFGRELKKFPLFVIIGVAGELIFNTLEFGSAITLEVWHSAEVAKANVIASTANERSKKLQLRTTSLELQIVEGKERIATLETNVANLEIGKKKIEATQTTHGAQIIALERRRIFDTQEKAFRVAAVALPNKKESLFVLFTDGDDESERYAKEIAGLLRDVGFAAAKPKVWHGGPPVKPGVSVCLKNPGDLRIFEALKRVNIATEALKFRKGVPDAPESQYELRDSHPFWCDQGIIFVGLKPALG
jgi:hypothetical protein